MNKKLSIFAIILIIVGTIGSIWSGIKAVPYVMDIVYNAEEKINTEHNIYNEEVDIDKIDISTIDTNIRIRKHDNNNVIINRKGSYEHFKYDINKVDKSLIIKEVESDIPYQNRNTFTNLNDLFNKGLESLFLYDIQEIVIYVPKELNISVETHSGGLEIEEDVLLDNLEMRTSRGYISLPREIKTLNNLNITSNSGVSFTMSELLGIKDVNINARSVDINSDNREIFIENIEDHIPQNIIINKNTKDDAGNIYIGTDIPAAKNLVINGYNTQTRLSLPIEKYKINFDVKASQRINIRELVDNTINNTEENSERNEELREVKGILNKELENLENEYTVNVKSEYVEIN